MQDPNVSAPDDERLIELVGSIVDGVPIDWPAATPAGSDAGTSSLLARLQRLEQLVRGHEAVRTRPAPKLVPALETVLTEARRQARQQNDQPLRVRWGPLIVLDKIGRGSFGDVYRAWDPRLDREVALKLIPEATPDADTSPVVEEGRLLARVRHPNVLTVHGAERIDRRVGIWTEYVRGETLAAEIARRGPLSADEAARIGIEVCRALAAVHGVRLLHRDVKAQNIMRDATGRIILGDFGTGVVLDEDAAVVEPQVAGTPLYLAPEVVEGKQATVGSDLYSVGVLLYFLVTGNYPVRGRTFADIRHAHASGERVPLKEARGDLPGEFVAIVEALLGEGPDRRYRTAGAAEKALEAWVAESVEAHSVGPFLRSWSSSPVWMVATALVVVGIIALVGLGALGIYASVRRGHWSGQSTNAKGLSTSDSTAPLLAAPAPVPAPNEVEAVQALSAALQFKGRDWVLISAFDNRTGENVLDGTLEYALERELSNSPFVNVAPRERIEDVLQLMRKAKDAKVDARLGREICLRDSGIRALVTGRVEKIGTAYVLTTQIVNPVDGGVMVSLTQEAARQADLLQAVRRQAFRVREALGEMMSTIQRSQVELEKVTTPSLHALQLYSRASAFLHGQDWKNEPAEELLKQAVTEDPAFASAYILLAHAISNQRRPKEEFMPHAERAAALATETTDVERYFILGSYHGLVADTAEGEEAKRERRKAIAAYEALIRIKPDHYWGAGNLAGSLMEVSGQNRATAHAFARAAEIRPDDPGLNVRAADLLFGTGDVDNGRRYLRRAQAVASSSDLTSYVVGILRARLALLDRDFGRARSIADELAGQLPGIKIAAAAQSGPGGRLTLLYADLGRFDDAQRAAQNMPPPFRERCLALILALRLETDFPGAADSLRNAATELYRRDGISRDLVSAPVMLASYFATLGMVDELKDLAARVKDDHSQTPQDLLEIDEKLAVAEGRIEDAVRLFQSAKGGRIREPVALLRMAWPLANALLAGGHWAEAARVLETVTANQWRYYAINVGTSVWIASRNRLATLYRSMGRAKEADAIDAELLKLLAVADADHPVLMRLKASQAKP